MKNTNQGRYAQDKAVEKRMKRDTIIIMSLIIAIGLWIAIK